MEIKIVCNKYMPPDHIWVPPNLYELIKKQFGVEELDKKFLEALGIEVNDEGNQVK